MNKIKKAKRMTEREPYRKRKQVKHFDGVITLKDIYR